MNETDVPQAIISSIDRTIDAAFEDMKSAMLDHNKCCEELASQRRGALTYFKKTEAYAPDFDRQEAYASFLETFAETLRRLAESIVTEEGVSAITPDGIKTCSKYALEKVHAMLEGTTPEIPFSQLPERVYRAIIETRKARDYEIELD